MKENINIFCNIFIHCILVKNLLTTYNAVIFDPSNFSLVQMRFYPYLFVFFMLWSCFLFLCYSLIYYCILTSFSTQSPTSSSPLQNPLLLYFPSKMSRSPVAGHLITQWHPRLLIKLIVTQEQSQLTRGLDFAIGKPGIPVEQLDAQARVGKDLETFLISSVL